jgi:tRNA nucleotidyltransferase (CCA-adding enzyme)
MPDYVYLLENRLSPEQRHALTQLREAARNAETILFLTGDAVRDLTSGHAVRELEVAIHGNALKLKKPLEKLGGKIWGEDEASRSLYLCFPGTVRVDLVSTHRVEYPKPGRPVYHPASIQEDLRRRDFTANSMAISLNEGSFGLLMDPLNGAADIEARALRLVSNYGFLEEPALLIRATRYRARLGWEMDSRTLARYENAKAEGVIEALSSHARSQELEQIGHEEEGLRVLGALQEEGWMNALYPAWTTSKADEPKLKAVHALAVELLVQGVHADTSAAQMQLLTAGMASRDLTALKKLMLRPGFVEEWNSLDALAAGFQKVLLAKQSLAPSASFKLFTSYDPEAVLWLGFTSKNQAVLDRYNQFLKVWPEAHQRIPYLLMQEMRITPELPGYKDLVHAIFLELIDGRLTTPEEMRAYLEPHSPPAPPPQVSIKKTRARRSAESKIKDEALDEDEESDGPIAGDDDEELGGGDEDEMDMSLAIRKGDLEEEPGEDEEEDEEEAEEEPAAKPASKKAGAKAVEAKPEKKAQKPAAVSTGKTPAAPTPAALPAANPAKGVKTEPAASANPALKGKPVPAGVKPQAPPAPTKPVQTKPVLGKPAPAKQAPLAAKKPAAPAQAAKPVVPAKATKPTKPAVKQQAKPQAKPASKSPVKGDGKKQAKGAPAKPQKSKPAHSANAKAGKPAKPAKTAPKKPAKKR